MNNYQTIADYYAQHRNEIVGFIAMRIGNEDTAQDLVQDVFLRLLRSDKLISPTTLPALVFTMARNAVADWFRRRRIREEYEHYWYGRQPRIDGFGYFCSRAHGTHGTDPCPTGTRMP